MMLVDTAAIDGARLSFRCVEHFPAGFIASGAEIAVQGTGGAVRSTDGKPQDFPLLCFREIL